LAEKSKSVKKSFRWPRVDAFVGARLWLRDLFAPLHHLVLEGNVGYGWFVDGDDPVRGVYGSEQSFGDAKRVLG